VKLLKTGGATGMTLSMWIDKPPFDDVRVRQAMKLVVDRKAINDTAMLGLGEVGNDSPIPPSNPDAYSKEIPKRDVAKAKQLLAEAGHPNGIQIDLYSSTNLPGMLNIAQAYVQMAAEAGIKVNLIQAPPATYWSETWLKVPFMTSGWAARPPIEALGVAYTKDAKWPETHWFRDDYDALLAKAAASADPKERAGMLNQLQTMLVREGGAIIPVFAPVVAAVRSECSGYTPLPSLNYLDFSGVSCKR
jgi:peptide/nickel transport system substrate-binding protein